MRINLVAGMAFVAVLALVAGGVLVIATSHVAPRTETVRMAVPDDKIAH